MSKMYYTDGLDAAIMARDFGVQFKSARGQDLYFDGGADFRILKDTGIYGGEYFYIHPDSIDIFKPMVRDLIKKQFTESQADSYNIIYNGIQLSAVVKAETPIEIIQRDGKSFFNPEVSDE